MERRDNKLNYKIGGIVAIAIVASIVGTLAFTSFQTNSDSQTQSIGIGAFVTIEAYHGDGTLFQKWEGHNALSVFARNALVGCITGLDDTPGAFESCNLGVDSLFITEEFQDGSGGQGGALLAEITPKPDGCNLGGQPSEFCTGWEMKVTKDFESLNCTPTVDCVDIIGLGSYSAYVGNDFNTVEFPVIPIEPNDRLVVTMTFDIPE